MAVKLPCRISIEAFAFTADAATFICIRFLKFTKTAIHKEFLCFLRAFLDSNIKIGLPT